MDLLDGDVELTEFEAIDVLSVKGVGQGANGFPILMMKGMPAPVAKGARDCPECSECSKTYDADHAGENCEDCGAKLPDAPASKAADDGEEPSKEKSALGIAVKAVTDGKIDQGPDISLGHQIMGLLAQAIQQEAQEIGAGSYGETCDVDLLNCAASMISRWVGREAAPGSDDDAGMLMQSAAKAAGLSMTDYARKLLGPEKGAPKPDDASKSEIAKEDKTVDTGDQGTGSLAKAVEEAVTKAMAPLQERITSLDAELAKVKATPVPGGPVLSRNVQVKAPGGVVSEDWVAKAAYFREQAQIWDSQDRGTADGYRKLAREADARAVTPTS
jgi:hypothetical protein